jgi:ElaA protein
MELRWYLKSWNELTPNEVYELLALRIHVFVVEQNCPYQDADGKDYKSHHLFALDEHGKCMACARLVMPGVSYAEWSIGRVVTHPSVRMTGVGRELMMRCMEALQQQFEAGPVRISAQCYLRKFYASFGFEEVSEEYLEDDIPHVEMLFSPH